MASASRMGYHRSGMETQVRQGARRPRIRRQKVRHALLTSSLLLLPVTLYYFSPALSLQGAAAGVASGSVLVFAGLFVSALFLGRAFCGWSCPMGGLQELTARLRGRPVARLRIRWIKYLVWGPWFLLLVYLVLQAGGFRRTEFGYQTWHGISVASLQGLVILLAVALLFFLPAALVGRRASCHTVCWVAPFLVAGRTARNFLAWPALRLSGRAQACRRCGSCSDACPMSIDVQENLRAGRLETTDCILCGSCVDACPSGALRFRFGKGRDT
jgi:polyferredoxin